MLRFRFLVEGGRLEKELAYMRRTLGEGAGSTHQILIQTPSSSSPSSRHDGGSGGQAGSVLSRDALLTHLRAVHAATKVTVDMFDTYVCFFFCLLFLNIQFLFSLSASCERISFKNEKKKKKTGSSYTQSTNSTSRH